MPSPAPTINLPIALRHLRRDPRLAPVVARSPQPNFKPASNAFRALVESILYQQISGKAADAIYSRFLDLFPARRFPTPNTLLAVHPPTLRAAGLSNQKAAYILDLALKFTDGTLQPKRFSAMTDEEISEHLIQVKGIGQWTADMFLIFALNRPDVLPVGDLGIRYGFRKLFKLRKDPTPDKMRILAEPWRPYRSAASWYLWRANELD